MINGIFKKVIAAFMLASLVLTCFSCEKADKESIDPAQKGAFLDITVEAGEVEKFVSDRPYDESKEEGAILAVLKDGYMYKDRVLVAALVKVNKKPEVKNETEENSDNENKEN